MLSLIIFVFARFHKEQGTRRFSSVDICSGLLKSPHKFSSKENLIFSSAKCQLKISQHWKNKLLSFSKERSVVKNAKNGKLAFL